MNKYTLFHLMSHKIGLKYASLSLLVWNLSLSVFLVSCGLTPSSNNKTKASPKPEEASEYIQQIILPDCGNKNQPPKAVKHIQNNEDWDSINSDAFRIFCVHPGDYISKGAISLSRSGSSVSPRIIRWYSESDPDLQVNPVQLSLNQRAILEKLNFTSGVQNWIVSGMTFYGSNSTAGNLVYFHSDSFFNLVNLSLMEGAGSGSGQVRIQGDNNTLQNCVLRKTAIIPGSDIHAIKVRYSASNTKIVSNEIYDFAGDGIQIGGDSTGEVFSGTIIADNDIFCESYCTDEVNNVRGFGENAIDLKAGGASGLDNWMRIVGNRMWGYVQGGGTSDDGYLYQALLDVSAQNSWKSFVLVQNNILFNSYNAITLSKGGGVGQSDHWSIIGNLIFNIERRVIDVRDNAPNSELFYNTIVNGPSGLNWLSYDATSSGSEVKCNVLVNARRSDLNASNLDVSHNGFYGDTDIKGSNNVFGSVTETQGEKYCFLTRSITGSKKVCVNYALPSLSSPFLGHCDSMIGSIANRGVNDESPYLFKNIQGTFFNHQSFGAFTVP